MSRNQSMTFAALVWLAASSAGWARSPIEPGATVSFRLPDRTTGVKAAAEPSAIGLMVVGSNAERARTAADAAVRGLRLTGPGGGEVSFSTQVVPGGKDLSGDVRLRVDVVRPGWEPGWYELRLTLNEPGVILVQSDPVLRFRIGSEPLLRAASVCVKEDGRRMVALDLSEPIAGGGAAVLVLADGTPCPDPAAGALAGREPIPRQRLYRLCPPQGAEATLRLSAPLTGRSEFRWSLPGSSDLGEEGEPCRRLAVE